MTERTTKDVTVHLPSDSGIRNIYTDDWGMGPVLVVELQNGMTISLDALSLGDHEVQVAAHCGGAGEMTDNVIAGFSVDTELAPIAWAETEDEWTVRHEVESKR